MILSGFFKGLFYNFFVSLLLNIASYSLEVELYCNANGINGD